MNSDGWIKSSQSLVTISAFLAGISAALLILILDRNLSGISGNTLLAISTLLVLSISLFAMASEVFTDALEFSDASRSVQAILAHDAAIAVFLLALSGIIWVEGLDFATIVAGGFSAYFVKDVVWLLRGGNRTRYQKWLERGSLDHEPEKFDEINVIVAMVVCSIAGLLAGAYVLVFETTPATLGGFATALAAGYTLFGSFYLRRSEFASDAQATIAFGTALMFVGVISTGHWTIILAVVFDVIGLVACLFQRSKSANPNGGQPTGSQP